MISAFGGSIRYRENFLEELFDDVSDVPLNNDAASISNEILSQTLDSQEEMEENILPPPVASTPTVEQPPATPSPPSPSPSKPASSVKPAQTNYFETPSNSYGPVIEAFDGGLYASAP
jgi:hypothetical protein